ncbi:putative HTH-type transcriptional regulator [Flavobacteriaceae bacterium UJ101]|nr:putative HTH-type transcriptional regulator [Flavobacteriaceae bacterium UJ101]
MFTRMTKYGIRAIFYIAKERTGHKRFKANDIAKALDIPEPFLKKILQQLSQKKIVSSSKGPGGGFYMNEENLQKTIFDIVIVLEGDDIFNKCVLDLYDCSDRNPCPLHDKYSILKRGLEKKFKEQTIQYVIDNLDGIIKI